ncbi:hypothetical protein B0H13DRAFT_2337915 [Mycena leptocephala]|nr:hypothetical protein B0H13DRAFT_2337915 [Mycena leptocephala]
MDLTTTDIASTTGTQESRSLAPASEEVSDQTPYQTQDIPQRPGEAPPGAVGTDTAAKTPVGAPTPPGSSPPPHQDPPPPPRAPTPPATAPPKDNSASTAQQAPPADGVYIPPPRPAIVKREPKKKGRRKSGEEPGKPGKASWVWGTKLVFFEKRKDMWLLAHENKTPGEFYTKVARLFTAKYGWELGEDEDFEEDVEDPPDWVSDKVVNERLSPEETKSRQKFHDKLRDRIGQWYRGQYSGLVKRDKSSFAELFVDAPDKPRQPQLVQFYSTRYYDTRVKDRFDERWQALLKRAEHSGLPPPKVIKVQNEVTKEVWDDETPEFQAEVERARDKYHAAMLKAWEDSLADSPSKTPEELDGALKNAAHYLKPFSDAMAEKYGMCVSILLCGPIGSRGGRVEMRRCVKVISQWMLETEAKGSVHSGKTKGLVRKDWPLHDPMGFRAVETSMVEFAHNVFSQAECEARKTGLQEVDPPAPSTSGPPGENAAGPRPRAAVPMTATTTMPTTTPAMTTSHPANSGTRGDSGGANGGEDDEGGGNGGEGGEGDEEGGADAQEMTDRLWNRRDRKKWTPELSNAHKAFERGRDWGIAWAGCVDKFMDFEAACGYSDAGGQISTEGRPTAVGWWLGRGRKWDRTVDVGTVGDAKTPDTFVATWWKWWMTVQPKDRSEWGPMAKLHGKNGVLQVMATLLWWGEAIDEDDPLGRIEWGTAVEEVEGVFTEMLRSGAVAKMKQGERKKDATRGIKRKSAEGSDKDRRGRSKA